MKTIEIVIGASNPIECNQRNLNCYTNGIKMYKTQQRVPLLEHNVQSHGNEVRGKPRVLTTTEENHFHNNRSPSSFCLPIQVTSNDISFFNL